MGHTNAEGLNTSHWAGGKMGRKSVQEPVPWLKSKVSLVSVCLSFQLQRTVGGDQELEASVREMKTRLGRQVRSALLLFCLFFPVYLLPLWKHDSWSVHLFSSLGVTCHCPQPTGESHSNRHTFTLIFSYTHAYVYIIMFVVIL